MFIGGHLRGLHKDTKEKRDKEMKWEGTKEKFLLWMFISVDRDEF